MTGHLLLLDASGFAFRAFYAWNPVYRESDGQPVGAVLGFMSMMWRVLQEAEHDKPTHAAAVFDPQGPTWRHKLWPEYKANRDPARRVELDMQFHYMRHAAETLGLQPVELEGFEADDVIATLAARAKKLRLRTTIVSSDKDFGQMVEDGVIEIVDPMKRTRVLEKDVRKKFGVEPALVPHVQALAGDAVDGIPGISGIGIERAQALIRRFGSVKAVVKNRGEILSPKIRNSLKDEGANAALFLKLTTLKRNAPLGIDFDHLLIKPPVETHLRGILRALEASEKFDVLFTNVQKTMLIVEPMKGDPLAWWKSELRSRGTEKLPEIPQCGFFVTRLHRGGPWVGARIWREVQRDLETDKPTGKEIIYCEVNGRRSDPVRWWPGLSNNVTTMEDAGFELADAAWAKRFAPDDPKANPHKPIDFTKQSAASLACPPSKKGKPK